MRRGRFASGSGSFDGVDRTLVVPQGTFELHRYPERSRSTLRAWDAADAFVLRALANDPPTGPVIVVNDGFGALAAGLHEHDPTVVADSLNSRIGIEANLDRNGLDPVTLTAEVPPSAGDGAKPADGFTTVVIKVPKSLGQLEEQLHQLRPLVTADTVILGAGMVKQIHTSTLELFERILGSTTTSLAERKARLIHCRFDPERVPDANPWPLSWRYDGMTIVNRGGVFSATSVDIGSRFLLENLPAPTGGHVIDLGCGNGLLGVAAAIGDVAAEVTFVDVSAAAIDSAQQSWEANHPGRIANVHLADRLVNVAERATADLVLNNPPFHDERAVGDATAWDMFVDSHLVLKPGGELRVVANRQLGHHSKLKKIFGNCETVAANRKFVVLSARRNTGQARPPG